MQIANIGDTGGEPEEQLTEEEVLEAREHDDMPDMWHRDVEGDRESDPTVKHGGWSVLYIPNPKGSNRIQVKCRQRIVQHKYFPGYESVGAELSQVLYGLQYLTAVGPRREAVPAQQQQQQAVQMAA